jgi:hypothetical protein
VSEVVDLTDATAISVVSNHACAVRASGGIVCWRLLTSAARERPDRRAVNARIGGALNTEIGGCARCPLAPW